ncbi:DUF3269 family protein [Staphylococcus simulans]|uniref:DUF3269 family protein n=1 Tax=Staphylococcus simulans TaxID=1286 RepID=UPI000D1E8307|nr:DUF3269 family protein [Staphylococcus simulans]PTJ91659.1 hypothetical protein BU032_04880 [Staphylococcus simulans]
MGLIDGAKKKYYLKNKYGEIAFSVIPLAEDTNYVGNMAGMHYQKMKTIKTDKELAEFIKANNLVK